MYPTLERLHERFELDFCGEGGEYESLVIDSRVFKKTLMLNETVIDYDHEDDSVGCLRVLACDTCDKLCVDRNLATSNLLTGQADKVLTLSIPSLELNSPPFQSPSLVHEPSLYIGADGLCQTGLLLPAVHQCSDLSPGGQLQDILQGLAIALTKIGFGIKDTVYVHLYVANMGQFEDVNAEYGKWFGLNPPSRSCVQVLLLVHAQSELCIFFFIEICHGVMCNVIY